MYYVKKIMGFGDEKGVSSADFSDFQTFSAKADLYRIVKEEKTSM